MSMCDAQDLIQLLHVLFVSAIDALIFGLPLLSLLDIVHSLYFETSACEGAELNTS